MVEKYLYSLLQGHDCVIVPGFGGFLAREQAAFIHPITNRILPPSRKAAFNEQLQLNDGLLVMSVAAGEEISQDAAMMMIRQFVAQLQTLLAKQGKVELEKLGTFVLNRDKKLDFTPAPTQNLSENSFGLPELFFKPLDSTSDAMTKLPNKTIRPATARNPEMQLDSNGKPVKAKKSNAAVKVVSILVPILLVIGGAGFWVINQQKDQSLQNLSFASLVSLFTGEEKAAPAAPAKPEVAANPADSVAVAPVVEETSTEAVSEAPAVAEEVTTPAASTGNEDLNLTKGVSGHYYVVTGAFSNPENAVRQQQKLISAGQFAVILNPGAGKLYKVCLGDFGSLDQAVQKKNELSSSIGADGLWVLKY